MNIILLQDSDFDSQVGRFRLYDRRLEHIVSILKLSNGGSVSIGMINGQKGVGRIVKLDQECVELEVELNQDPPKELGVNLVLALPRPPMLKRILFTASSMGVKRIVLLQTNRVEKSFWSSSVFKNNEVEHHLRLGLEQSGDTTLAKITLEKRFRPFVEDVLPKLAENTAKLFAHPNVSKECPYHIATPVTLVIGPEGGFVPFEVDLLQAIGFEAVSLGPRILRVETAVPVLLGRCGLIK